LLTDPDTRPPASSISRVLPESLDETYRQLNAKF
jgi:hypothetical protein